MIAKWMLYLMGTLAASTLLGGCQTLFPEKERTAVEWQAMARADLDAAHKWIIDAHPGAIDEQNPAFKVWAETGYQEALKLTTKVISYDTALAAVRYYVTGFLDGHMAYSDDIRGNVPMIVNGWRVEMVGGDYVVWATAPNWPVALPPKGAKLIACDGRTPGTIIKEDVAPYIDRRDFPAVRRELASGMLNLHEVGVELRRCQFRTHEGEVLDLAVSYQPITTDEYFRLFFNAKSSSKRRGNSFELKNGVLWIHAANFNLREPEVAELESMLAKLRSSKSVEYIVFDSRGNTGGSSGVGDRIFEAATGGLEYDRQDIERLPRTFAQWRVSEISIATAGEHVARMTRLYGGKSAQAASANSLLNDLNAAKAAGKPWIEQRDGYRVTNAEVARRHGKLRRFTSKVALLTDSNCASACLDFADQVRLVPGAVHLGSTTSADAVYIDAGFVNLPSGNHLMMSLKVWRNRIRGNNEPLVPDVKFDIDLEVDAAVYAATVAALKQ